jgi:hypothetical protein
MFSWLLGTAVLFKAILAARDIFKTQLDKDVI